MNDRKRHLIVNGGLALTFAILVSVGWLCYHNMMATSESDRSEKHTYVVIQALDALLSGMRDAETGQRGFIITGNQKYLEPYRRALGQVDQILKALRAMTRDNR